MTGPVASIGVAVVPDATDFWRKFEAKTLPQAAKTGEREGAAFMRGFDAATRKPESINVNVNTTRALASVERLRTEIKAMGATSIAMSGQTERAMGRQGRAYEGFYKRILRWAALLGPALVPIGATAAAGLVAVGPAAATAVLGIKGLENQYKSGALKGSEFANTIGIVKREYTTLQKISAGPLAVGITKAVDAVKSRLPAVNQEFRGWAASLGTIVGTAGPGLVSVLLKLQPMFDLMSAKLVQGAAGFRKWADSSGSLKGFMSYVEQTLPRVLDTLGNFGRALGQVLAAVAPYGEGVLSIINGISKAMLFLSRIKIGNLNALQILASGALSVYAAFRTLRGITGIVNGISTALGTIKASATGAATAVTASSTQMAIDSSVLAAAVKVDAASIAEARAVEARAAAEAAVTVAAAEGEMGAADDAYTSLVARNAVRVAEIRDAQVVAAQAAARAQLATADTSALGGGLGTLGKIGKIASATIGPLAALGIGITLLTGLFHSNNKAAEDNTNAMQAYGQSLSQSSNALDRANTSATQKLLTDRKAFDQLDKLHGANELLNVSQSDLVTGINKGGAAYTALVGQLDGVIKKYHELRVGLVGRYVAPGVSGAMSPLAASYQASEEAAQGLRDKIVALHTSLTAEQKQQELYIEVQRELAVQAAGGADAAAHQAGAMHLGYQAYLDASTAAKQLETQTAATTASMQAENDVTGLLQQALDGLAGSSLSLSEANDSMHSAMNNVTKEMAKGHDSITGYSKEALTNRDNINQAARASQQYAEAIGKSTKSGDLAVSTYKAEKTALLDQIKAHGELTPKVRAYVNQMFDVKDIQDYISKHPTKFDADTNRPTSKINQLKGLIRSIRQDKVPGLDADSSQARAVIAELKRELDALHGKTITIATQRVVYTPTSIRVGKSGPVGKAAGGYISGPGSGTSDSILRWVSNGEFVVNARATAQHLALLQSINNGVKGYAAGGVITTHGRGKKQTWTLAGTTYDSAQAVINAYNAQQKTEHKAVLRLQIQVDRTDYSRFVGDLKKDASTISDAYVAMRNDLRDAGASAAKLAQFDAREKTLIADVNKRTVAVNQLASATGHLSDIQKTYNDQIATARQATLGGFDITSAGTGAYSGQVASFASIYAQQTQAANQAKAEQAAVATLIKKGLSGAYVQQLAGAGTNALPQMQALASASTAQIALLNKQYRAMYGSGTATGTAVASYLYGRQLDTAKALVYGRSDRDRATNADVSRLATALYGKNAPATRYLNEGLRTYTSDTQKTVTTLGKQLATSMTGAVNQLAKRPVVLIANDRELARAVAAGEKKNKRR